MSWRSIGKPVVITPEIAPRFAEIVSKPSVHFATEHPKLRHIKHFDMFEESKADARENGRTVTLTVSVTAREAKLLTEFADERKVSLDDYLRDAILESMWEDIQHRRDVARWKAHETEFSNDE